MMDVNGVLIYHIVNEVTKLHDVTCSLSLWEAGCGFGSMEGPVSSMALSHWVCLIVSSPTMLTLTRLEASFPSLTIMEHKILEMMTFATLHVVPLMQDRLRVAIIRKSVLMNLQ